MTRPARALVCLSALALVALTPGEAQEPAAPEPATVQTVRVTPTAEPIRVDGVLDETVWETALALPVPWEWSPADNEPAPAETTVLVTFDAEHLYVAFRASDPDPGAIRAHYGDRDTVSADDTVGFMIDPFSDQRRAFQFRVNPLGVQMDAVNSDVEGTEDFSWDAIWDSAGRITKSGYVVEIAVPFRQLRFPRTAAAQTWGFLAMREYPRSIEHRMRSIVTDKARSCLVCQFQRIEGLEGMSTGANLEVTPTLTGRYTEARDDDLQGRFQATDEVEPGLTTRWGVTPNISLSGTLNPDFSQVEADAAQLDVNTRFALFFPEKRPFFLEGADFFETPLALVFTRTVADPVAGVKLTGKEGPNAFGAFVAQDRINNLVIPGSQGSSLTSIDEDVTSGVLRWRRDLGEASTLGLLYTGRVGDGVYQNHLAGVDGLYRLTDSDSLRFQLVGSSTRYPEAVAERFGQPTGDLTGHSLLAAYSHSDADWFWFGDYSQASPGFRADYGFIPRVGIRRASAGAERRIRGGEETWYSNLFFFLAVDAAQEYDGAWNEWGSDAVFTYQGPQQSYFTFGVAPNQEVFDGVTYQNFRQLATAGFQPSGSFELDLSFGWGETIDFANSRQADFVQTAVDVGFFAGRRVQGELEIDRQVVDVQGGELFTLDITQTRLIYHFGLRSFLRLILQYRQIDRDPELYTFAVEPSEEDLLTQLLFSYKLNAQTVFLVGYSDHHAALRDIDLTQTDRTVFFKIGYAWLR